MRYVLYEGLFWGWDIKFLIWICFSGVERKEGGIRDLNDAIMNGWLIEQLSIGCTRWIRQSTKVTRAAKAVKIGHRLCAWL